MNIKFNPKQEEVNKITNTKELAGFIIAGCNEKEKMSDEDKARMDARILEKLKSGKKLTQKELDYLRACNKRNRKALDI